MKKILSVIVLYLFLIPNISFALSIETYLKKRESKDFILKNNLDFYVSGVLSGIWDSHKQEWKLRAYGELKRMVFCAPSTWEPDLKDAYSYLDSQISFIKTKGWDYKYATVSGFMNNYLIRTYPCKK